MSNRTADLDLTGATEAFCARLLAEGRSPATIAAYRRDLALVARVAGELAPGIVCRAVTAGLLDQVFSAGAVTESERGPRSAASLHRMKAAVRALGHRDVSTTQIYTHLVDGQLEEALERL